MADAAVVKTTLELSDHLLLRAKCLAKAEKTTLRSLTEEGLKHVLDTHEKRRRVSVSPITFKGRGLSAEFKDATWKRIRDAAYGQTES